MRTKTTALDAGSTDVVPAPDLFNDVFEDRPITARSKCTASECRCIGYVSDLTNRRICTCGHAAANHESGKWEASAWRAMAGTRPSRCTASECRCTAYVSDLTNRRVCTCGHAAANHKSDVWEASAVEAAAPNRDSVRQSHAAKTQFESPAARSGKLAPA
jgi:hypothetical protein